MTFWIIFCVLSKLVIGILLFIAIRVYQKEYAIPHLGEETRSRLTRLTDEFFREVLEIQEKQEKQNEHK
jgi:hypothetical protein